MINKTTSKTETQKLEDLLKEAIEKLEFANKTLQVNREYTDGLQEEKTWHSEQYCLMRDERDALERQIELEHELIEVKDLLSKAKTKRKRIDREYIESIEFTRAEKKVKRQEATQ